MSVLQKWVASAGEVLIQPVKNLLSKVQEAGMLRQAQYEHPFVLMAIQNGTPKKEAPALVEAAFNAGLKQEGKPPYVFSKEVARWVKAGRPASAFWRETNLDPAPCD